MSSPGKNQTHRANNDMYVISVNWRGHLKRLQLSEENVFIDVPLSACVTQNDNLRITQSSIDVICKNGYVPIYPFYTAREILNIGAAEVEVLIKEITDITEYVAYNSLAGFHYRGKRLFGRTAKLIVRSFNPLFPHVIGYVEITSPLYMNKARSVFLDAPFSQNGVSWDTWNTNTKRQHIHALARVARCVIYPEFRGLGLGQILMRHAALFAQSRWQIANYKPYFLEISADMLKYVPFAEQAGMTYVGETEGNLARVYKDLRYLIKNADRINQGEIVQEDSNGIVDQQVARMQRAFTLMDEEDISVNELLNKLLFLSEKSALQDFALLHEIISLPKPSYIQGLSEEAIKFVRDQSAKLPTNIAKPKFERSLEVIDEPIEFINLSIVFKSNVQRTKKTHIVQQAFGISPDNINTMVLNKFSLQIKPGEVILVLGPSGSGKTAFLDTLTQFQTKNSNQRENIEYSGKIFFPNNYSPYLMKETRSKKPLIEILTKKNLNVDQALQLMGVVGLSDAYVYLKRYQELSKGQQFRAMLAELIASESNVWIIDEFCSNLDVVTANVISVKLQRTAREFGATVIVAAPHCQAFVHSLKPDKVIQLTTAWEYRTKDGKEFLDSINKPDFGKYKAQSLRLKQELFDAVIRGEKKSTIRKGRRIISKGPLILEAGNESCLVYATSVKHCALKSLTDEDALKDGYKNKDDLLKAIKQFYPTLLPRNLVTVISFEEIANQTAVFKDRDAN